MKKSILKLGKALEKQTQKNINGGGRPGQPGNDCNDVNGHPGPEGEDRPCHPVNNPCACNQNSGSGFGSDLINPNVRVG